VSHRERDLSVTERCTKRGESDLAWLQSLKTQGGFAFVEVLLTTSTIHKAEHLRTNFKAMRYDGDHKDSATAGGLNRILGPALAARLRGLQSTPDDAPSMCSARALRALPMQAAGPSRILNPTSIRATAHVSVHEASPATSIRRSQS
jgi:hypothetical protein